MTFYDYDYDYASVNDAEYEAALEAREAEADWRSDCRLARVCTCRGGQGPYDPIDGPEYWAESDCPVHGDDVDEDDDEDEE